MHPRAECANEVQRMSVALVGNPLRVLRTRELIVPPRGCTTFSGQVPGFREERCEVFALDAGIAHGLADQRRDPRLWRCVLQPPPYSEKRSPASAFRRKCLRLRVPHADNASCGRHPRPLCASPDKALYSSCNARATRRVFKWTFRVRPPPRRCLPFQTILGRGFFWGKTWAPRARIAVARVAIRAQAQTVQAVEEAGTVDADVRARTSESGDVAFHGQCGRTRQRFPLAPQLYQKSCVLRAQARRRLAKAALDPASTCPSLAHTSPFQRREICFKLPKPNASPHADRPSDGCGEARQVRLLKGGVRPLGFRV